MEFQYLIDKINDAKSVDYPYNHIQIQNFFNDEHLKAITESKEISASGFESDKDLFSALFDKGYKIIDFPGCIVDREVYLKWHRESGSKPNYINTACEGFGMTLRLMAPTSPVITELSAFMKSQEFQGALAAKFGIELDTVFYDSGIQKYLDGYEISPHPDVRKKALTYMVNINPNPQSETQDHHTSYLTFKDEFKYVQSYWDGHPNEDRCWVPWSWCDTKKVQRENNSIVIFHPNNDTMHGVKASYNHLNGQRTQMYGNLWYNEKKVNGAPSWESFVIKMPVKTVTFKSKLKAAVPSPVRDLLKGRDENVVSQHIDKF